MNGSALAGESAAELLAAGHGHRVNGRTHADSAAVRLTGLALGVAVDKRWLALPAVVMAFLFQHGVQGWCPPLPVMRRLGFRTRGEIDREKYALKARLD